MTENKPTTMQQTHEISLRSRKRMSISGVCEVISFDEHAVNLRTVCGDLAIEGEGLHIGVLDTERGMVALEGDSVDGMWYLREDTASKRGLFAKWRT